MADDLTLADAEAIMAQYHFLGPRVFLMNPGEWAMWRGAACCPEIVASQAKGLPFERLELRIWTETPPPGRTLFAHVYLDAFTPKGKVFVVRDDGLLRTLAERWYCQCAALHAAKGE